MSGIENKWISYLRKGRNKDAEGRLDAPSSIPQSSPTSADHPQLNHGALQESAKDGPRTRQDPGGADDDGPSAKKLKSPSGSISNGRGQDQTLHRSRARDREPEESQVDFPRRSHPPGKIWEAGDPAPAAPARSANVPPQNLGRTPRKAAAAKGTQGGSDDTDNPTTVMIRQPETRPISQEQLVAEVKGIYAGLVMVESKCIEVDNAQNSQNEAPPRLNNEQWQALIALHRTLLHEHHDFFLASQHPSASPALRRLASKYAMPARMWRHGIHSFLELLRHRLPHSLEHMLTFIYLAYSMMALLYETVPAFEDTWIECLGDLGRYRMAIEDEDIRDREVWTGVSRHWYSRASDKAPTTGRLYHHLAILARPNAIQQLFFYTKSLCVAVPFNSARESIMTLFEPIMAASQRPLSVETSFVEAHGYLFTGKSPDNLPAVRDSFLSQLDNVIARQTRRWIETGSYIAISNGNAILEYGVDSNPIMRLITPATTEDSDVPMQGVDLDAPPELPPSSTFFEAQILTNRTDEIAFARFGDPNVLAYVHVRLAFMCCMANYAVAMAHLKDGFNFHLLTLTLNSIINSLSDGEKIDISEFPKRPSGQRPLPEDWALRGLLWTEQLFPADYFDEVVDEEEKAFEIPSFTEFRKRRILYLAGCLATQGDYFSWDSDGRQFIVSPAFERASVAKILTAQDEEALEDAKPSLLD
ncbi:hypothetical protein NKR23_g1920 [Pleurostoma richardsiae]|uniref:DNA/RNA-binding domain-containing protein n=1 Tax=Pleurostoma richardsiae TaxID=41990 RepID=A0AA38SC25_9PEZI|nr:hypothetical protein NKR23_g1920 [Pleurostoma richardsiae]